ncbi:replication initiation protein [Azonexus hydrophilus]|uniref:Replication initiation protein n=1 Tax=Azonexus hydrophilus TaxID=418702 RepID=A0ABZ2XLS1_9RHOO
MASSEKSQGKALVAQLQRSFDIFEEFDRGKKGIVESPVDFGFNKHPALIEITGLTLVSKRAINAVYFIASQNPESHNHDVDLSYFLWLANYSGSRNIKHLQKSLRECQKAAVELSILDHDNPDNDAAGAVSLLPKFFIAEGRIQFAIDDDMKRVVSSPHATPFLSIVVGNSFKSIYAYDIYERLLKFRLDGESPWMTPDEFRAEWVCTYQPKSPDYKFLKRDVLKPAIAQINEVSDINISLEERRDWRRVTAIRFKVNNNPEYKTRFSEAHELHTKFEILRKEFGLTSSDFKEIMANRDEFTNERIDEVIELVRHRAKQTAIGKPSRYFMTLLRDGAMLSDIERTQANQKALSASTAKERKEAQDRSADERQMAQSKVVPELTAQQQIDFATAFIVSPAGKLIISRFGSELADHSYTTLVGNLRTKSAFIDFIAKQTKPARPRKGKTAAE